MKKGRNLHGVQNCKRIYYYGSLVLLFLFMTSCKSNRFMIDSNEVENVNFWFIGDVDTDIPITDCLHIVFGNDSHKVIIRDRKIVERFVALVNQLKPATPDSYIDLRVSALIRLKTINGERRPDIKVCIGAGGYGVLLNDVLMKGNPKELQKFVQEELYDPLTPYEWLPDVIKGYLEDHPEERSKYLPDE
ncbi:hypothetical protein [Bacteroides sp. f07]|uniref:hypothetical protein n=1 Tax=Bacteroides sp. f07 TaxID=3132704 RepID=UPI0036F36F49